MIKVPDPLKEVGNWITILSPNKLKISLLSMSYWDLITYGGTGRPISSNILLNSILLSNFFLTL